MFDFIALVFASGLLMYAAPREIGTRVFCAIAIFQGIYAYLLGASLITTALHGV